MTNTASNEENWLWSPTLSVGVDAIDNDHKQLFELFHAAYLLSQQQINSPEIYCLVYELIDYTDSHFKREEAILSVSGYPFFDNHIAIHQQLIQQVKQEFIKIKSGQDSASDFVIFLKDWFIEHIKGTDQRIAQYVKGYETEIKQALEKVGPLQIGCCCKIFIVDDDEQQAKLMQEIAKAAQLKASIFTSSIAFLESSITEYDIVVLDLQMPEKDGIEIMRELAAQNIKPNFILVSGFDERVLHSAKQLAESKQLNVVTTLSKPIRAKNFIALLKETFKASKLKRIQETIADSPVEYVSIQKPSIPEKTNTVTLEDLKLAIRKHQLIVHFQPQTCFTTGKLKGAEILVRWQHPTKGLIFPDQFIPLAEEHQLMNLLTEEILRLAIKAYQKLTANEVNIQVSINLSAQNINDLSMPEKLTALVKSNKIEPESFILEITESALMNEISDSLDILNRLRMKGFSLSIDDFGTGYSSLVKLYQAPFTELKIDQHFIMRMGSDYDAAAIVRICILLAKELKMQTVAEGVETEEIWHQLKKLGCNIAQGYFIAKPMPVEDFCTWVKNWEKEHNNIPDEV